MGMIVGFGEVVVKTSRMRVSVRYSAHASAEGCAVNVEYRYSTDECAVNTVEGYQ